MADGVRQLFENVGTAPALVHVVIKGQTQEIRMADLDVGPNSSDEHVRAEVARHLGHDPSVLARTVVDRLPSGNISIRPEAVFG